ncbi:MAG TPA: aldo/keto reductase [Fimbriimonadaceae bacterium]|nr:aldo/keto reductase [Fimbriimonadaceae bacterium]
MRTTTLSSSSGPIEVSRLAYGAMRIAGTWNPDEITPERRAAAYASLQAAYDAGYTLFDHADIYCRGGCEQLHGDFLKEHSELRGQTVIATKCGIRFKGDPEGAVGRYDFSSSHIIWSCERSLERLGVDQIDLYQLHRPDLLMNPEEVAEAFAKLHSAGKVKAFGVSNFLPSTVTLLQKWLSFPISVNQIEVSLWRLDPFLDGTLDQCIRESIVPLSWGPVGGGRVGKEHEQGTTGIEPLSEALADVAKAHGSEPATIAFAWLLKHPSGIVPIVGSTNPARIRAAVDSLSVDLSREDWYRLLVAARGEAMP